MIVRFVSSLSHDDETLFARAVMKAMTGLLDLLPIAYSIRIETSTNTVYEHSRTSEDGAVPANGSDLRLVTDGLGENGL
jgi:hypothetical protein